MLQFTDTSTVTYNTCRHCGMIHLGNSICPLIEEIEYYKDGSVKRVKYFRSPPFEYSPFRLPDDVTIPEWDTTAAGKWETDFRTNVWLS